MSAVAGKVKWATWLDPTVAAAAGLPVPASCTGWNAYPVSTLVNNVKNNGPELLTPMAEGE